MKRWDRRGFEKRWFVILPLLLALVALAGVSCSKESPADVPDAGREQEGRGDESPPEPRTGRTGACALTKEEVSAIIRETVTESSSSGNWGIASTCTYATASSPVAVEVASVASGDISSDRAMEGARDIPDLGAAAVWIPATSRLTVLDGSRKKLLRIGVGLPVPEERRLEIATAIAGLALPRL